MSLRTATVLAIAGAAISTAFQFLSVIAHFVQPFANILYGSAGGFVSTMFLLVSVSYLIFFITLYGKQR